MLPSRNMQVWPLCMLSNFVLDLLFVALFPLYFAGEQSSMPIKAVFCVAIYK